MILVGHYPAVDIEWNKLRFFGTVDEAKENVSEILSTCACGKKQNLKFHGNVAVASFGSVSTLLDNSV